MTRYLHGGIAGLNPGDVLRPSPPQITDGCPICVARSAGLVMSVGVYRLWLQKQGPTAAKILEGLEGVPDDAPMDPPSAQSGVYLTTDLDYATFYAARSNNGDLYEVEPLGEATPSTEDHFPTWVTAEARVVRVLRRKVRLDRRDRRRLTRRWKRADADARR